MYTNKYRQRDHSKVVSPGSVGHWSAVYRSQYFKNIIIFLFFVLKIECLEISFFRRKLFDFQGEKDAQVLLFNLYTKFLEINASGFIAETNIEASFNSRKKIVA
jgi:hypothetical protein